MGAFGMPLPLKWRLVAVSVSLNTLFMRTEPGTVGTAARLSVLPVAHDCAGLVNGGTTTSMIVPSAMGRGCGHRNDLFLPGVLMSVPVDTVVRVPGAFPFQPLLPAAEPIPALTHRPAVSAIAAAPP